MAVFPAAGGGENRINTTFISVKNNLIKQLLNKSRVSRRYIDKRGQIWT